MAAPTPKDKPNGIDFYGGYEVYSESGVDLTMLRENLRQSLEERLQKGERALAFALALRESGRSRNESVRSSDWPLSKTEAPALLKRLATRHVQYVIVGSQAMHAHGSTLMSEEIDICYQRTPANLESLVATLEAINPALRDAPNELSFHLEVPTVAAGMNFPLITDCGHLNLLGEVSGIGNYDQVLSQSVERNVYGLSIRVLSVDGLIAAKKASGRIADLLVLRELLELKELPDPASQA